MPQIQLDVVKSITSRHLTQQNAVQELRGLTAVLVEGWEWWPPAVTLGNTSSYTERVYGFQAISRRNIVIFTNVSDQFNFVTNSVYFLRNRNRGFILTRADRQIQDLGTDSL